MKSKDGFVVGNLHSLEPLYKVTKNDFGKYVIKDMIALQLNKMEPTLIKEELESIFYVKDNADYEVFRRNKLISYPILEDYKGNYKKALRILVDFTDEELLNFVTKNQK
jgi:hypothetical protein